MGEKIMTKEKRIELEKIVIEIVAGSMEHIGEDDQICDEAASLTDSELITFVKKYSVE